MNERLRNWLPIPLMALAVYIWLVSLGVIAGLSVGLRAGSRMELYWELSRFGFDTIVAEAEPHVRWLLEPVLYHVTTIVYESAWFAYTNTAFVDANLALIGGFFQYVVPVVNAGLVGASVYLALSALDEVGDRLAQLLLRLVRWHR